jgi:hypothetical protein
LAFLRIKRLRQKYLADYIIEAEIVRDDVRGDELGHVSLGLEDLLRGLGGTGGLHPRNLGHLPNTIGEQVKSTR